MFSLLSVTVDCRLYHVCHMQLTSDSGLFFFEFGIIAKGDATLHLYVCLQFVRSDSKPPLMTIPTTDTKWEHSQMFTDKNVHK